MRSDPAGYVTKRFPLPGMPLPRYGTGCPLWAAYRAFQMPGTLLHQLVEMPGSDPLLLVARAVEKERADYGMPPHFLSFMLVCDAILLTARLPRSSRRRSGRFLPVQGNRQ